MEINQLPDYTVIARNIKLSRRQRGYTQEHLAQIIRVNPSHISNIENHRTRVSLPTLVSICRALDVSVDTLLKENQAYFDISPEGPIMDELQKCTPGFRRLALDIIILIAKASGQFH